MRVIEVVGMRGKVAEGVCESSNPQENLTQFRYPCQPISTIPTIHMKIMSPDVHLFVSIIRIQIRVVSVIRSPIHVYKLQNTCTPV